MAALSKWVPIGAAPIQSEESTTPPPIKLTTIDKIGGIYCHICHSTFGNKKEFDSHYVNHGTGKSEFVYTCVVCRKEIAGYPSFRGHCYLKHVTKDKFKCEQCDKVFSKLCVLNSHINTVHQYKCATCGNKFETQKQLLLHQIIHKNDQTGPPYECQTCGKQIESTVDCEQHIEEHCTMIYSCPICEETIDDINNATDHLAKHFGDVLTEESDADFETPEITNDSSIDLLGGIFCSYCEQIYKGRPDFDSHFMLDHPDKQIVYACNICGKEYEKYLVFANHCYYHYSKGRFQCEVCLKTYPRLSLLVAHVESHARRSPPGGTSTNKTGGWGCRCVRCGLRLGSALAAARHAPAHRRKAYACPVCRRQYAEKHSALKHLTHHFCSVLHICNICGKVYNARSRLNHHMKVHNEVKDHKCSFCGKGFTKLYLLKQHLNIHTGQRPYACTACPKTFASHPNLLKHMKCMHNITKIDIKLCYNPTFASKITNSNAKIQLNTEVYAEEITNNNTETQPIVDESPVYHELTTVYATPGFDEVEPCWKTDHVDPGVLEMLEDNLGNIDAINVSADDISELENALWGQSPLMPSEGACPPLEYGPDFVTADTAAASLTGDGSVVLLGERPLPHIDPRLTLRVPHAHSHSHAHTHAHAHVNGHAHTPALLNADLIF